MDVLEILNSLINYEKIGTVPRNILEFKTFVLQNVPEANLLDNIVHVVGTKGKGSTAYILSKALMLEGEHVGTFLSPHVLSIFERIKFNLEDIHESDFKEHFLEIYEHFKEKPKVFRTFFETLLCIALKYFYRKGTTFNVLEAGLGGRLDATNIFSEKTSLITFIDYDHMHVLGNTLKSIAYEKLLSVGEASVVITSYQHAEVMEVIEEVCFFKNCRLVLAKFSDVRITPEGTYFKLFGKESYLPVVGRFQAYNGALALAYMHIFFGKDRLEIDELFIPGRFNVFYLDGTRVVLDIAHNLVAFRELMYNLQTLYGTKDTVFVLSFVKDKDVSSISKLLEGYDIIPVRSSNPRSLPPDELAQVFSSKIYFNSLNEALEYALPRYKTVVISGSTYLVSDFFSSFSLRTLLKGFPIKLLGISSTNSTSSGTS